MIKQRNLTILLVLCISLVLRGDGCNILEQKDVEQVAGIPVPAEWVSEGYTEANFSQSQTLSLAEDIRDAMPDDPSEAEKILSIGVAGVQYKVLESTGHDAQRAGHVDINGIRILDFDVPGNETGRSGAAGDGSGELTMNAAGVDFVAGRLNTWLNEYKADPFGVADDGLLEFSYAVQWSSTPAPTAMDPDNFRWTTDLVLQVVQVITINEN